jgi:hypothetical protein
MMPGQVSIFLEFVPPILAVVPVTLPLSYQTAGPDITEPVANFDIK